MNTGIGKSHQSLKPVTKETIRRRVKRGAALLDERFPEWRTKVNPNRLAIKNCYHCVLGQLFEQPTRFPSGFSVGLTRLFSEYHYPGSYQHGFTLEPKDYCHWGYLESCWWKELSK